MEHSAGPGGIRMRPPFSWQGNKTRLAPLLLPLLPPHRCYVEPYGGSAALLLAKPPAPTEVYNDLDDAVWVIFRALRDEGERFRRAVEARPYSRREFSLACESFPPIMEALDPASPRMDPDILVEAGRLALVLIRQGFGGQIKPTGPKPNDFGYGPANKNAAAWARVPARLDDLVERLRGVVIEHLPALEVIRRYDSPDTVFFLDPPYAPDSRPGMTGGSGGKYRHEMTASDHEDLVRSLLVLQGKALLSGYDTLLYRPLEDAGWEKRLLAEMDVSTYSGARVRGAKGGQSEIRQEWVWISPGAMGKRAAMLLW